MTKKITVQYRDDKTSRTGAPWLSIKDTQGNSYSVWEVTLFHLFSPGKTLEVSIVTKGKYTNITDVLRDYAVEENLTQVTTVAQKFGPQENPQKETEEYSNKKILEAIRLVYKRQDEILEKINQLAPADEEIKKEDIPF